MRLVTIVILITLYLGVVFCELGWSGALTWVNQPCPEMKNPPKDTVYDCIPCGKGRIAVLYFKDDELFYRYYILPEGSKVYEPSMHPERKMGDVIGGVTIEKGERRGVGGESD